MSIQFSSSLIAISFGFLNIELCCCSFLSFLNRLFKLILLQPDSESQLLTIQFEWNGVMKAVSSTMIGVSPEFEMALYTLCFYAGGEENHVELGPYSVNIKCYRMGNRLGSAFPMG